MRQPDEQTLQEPTPCAQESFEKIFGKIEYQNMVFESLNELVLEGFLTKHQQLRVINRLATKLLVKKEVV